MNLITQDLGNLLNNKAEVVCKEHAGICENTFIGHNDSRISLFL